MAEKKSPAMEDVCRWAVRTLESKRSLSTADFEEHFGVRQKSEDERNRLKSIWTRARQAVLAILTEQRRPVKEDGMKLIWEGEVGYDNELDPYTTPNYQLGEETEAKERIGKLIASFLSKEPLKKKTIFLGSGTTIFHVGRQMCQQKEPYGQRFVTANIPLAAMFCKPRGIQPVNKITIPEAVLDTHTSRFSTMPGLNYPITVSIVAADGCVYDEESKKVEFYGNEDAVAANTNLFVQKTRHTVLFCLTHKKIQVGFAPNPNTGPPIHPPKNKNVIRVLVSNQVLYDPAVEALKADGWWIVTKDEDWPPVLEKMRKGEELPTDSPVGPANADNE